MIYCQSCGNEIEKDSLFCQSCGSHIDNLYSKETTIKDSQMEIPYSKQTKQENNRLIFWVSVLLSLIMLSFVVFGLSIPYG